MRRRWSPPGSARLPLLWAVALGLCLNPLGAAAAALAGAAGCASATCPCEAEAEAAQQAEHAEAHPGDDGCEQEGGCDDCRCGPATLLAVLPGLTPHLSWRGTSAQAQAPPADVALGVLRRMDRPPKPA